MCLTVCVIHVPVAAKLSQTKNKNKIRTEKMEIGNLDADNEYTLIECEKWGPR